MTHDLYVTAVDHGGEIQRNTASARGSRRRPGSRSVPSTISSQYGTVFDVPNGHDEPAIYSIFLRYTKQSCTEKFPQEL